jgi:hypothetical protein
MGFFHSFSLEIIVKKIIITLYICLNQQPLACIADTLTSKLQDNYSVKIFTQPHLNWHIQQLASWPKYLAGHDGNVVQLILDCENSHLS